MLERYREQAVAAVQRVVGDSAEAEDCVQDAMLRLVRRGDLDPGRVRSLLARAATHIAIDRRRSRRREEKAVARLRAGAPVEAPSPEEIAGEHADLERALAAIDSLPRRERQVMLLRLSGLSVLETAQRLGLSYKSVEGAYTRARARVRVLLGGALAWLAARLRRLTLPSGEALASAVAVLFIAGPFWHHDGQPAAVHGGSAVPQLLLAAGPGSRVDGVARGTLPMRPDASAARAGQHAEGSGGGAHHPGAYPPISVNTGRVIVPGPTGGTDPNNSIVYFGGVGVSWDPSSVDQWEQCLEDGNLPQLRYGDCYN